MNLIEILPNIYGVKVPMDAKNFVICTFTATGSDLKKYTIQYERELIKGNVINIPFNLKPLGTITATEIIFDASEVVKSNEFPTYKYGGELHPEERFWDYKEEQFWLDNSDDSFRSALPKEIYFENPFGETQVIRFKDKSKLSKIRDIEWQTAQQNITEKLLILQKL